VPLPRRRLPLGLLFLVALVGGLTATALWTDVGHMAVGLVRDKVSQMFPSSAPPPPANVSSTDVVSCGFVDVETRLVNLHPEQIGHVLKVLVEEGQAVKKGDELLRMDDEQAKLAVKAAQSALDTAQIQVQQAVKQPELLAADIRAQEAAVNAAERTRETAVTVEKSSKREFDLNLVKKDVYDRAVTLVQKAEADVTAQKEKLQSLRLRQGQLQLDVDRAKSEVAGRKVQLEQAEDTLKRCVLKAPADGKILRVNASEGEMLIATPKEPAILFAPAEKRIVRAEVQQEVADDVDQDQPVTIEDDLRPGKSPKWTGKIKRTGGYYAPRRQIIQEPRQQNDVRTLEFVVEVKDSNNLRIGQRVRVTFRKKAVAKTAEPSAVK